MALHILKRRELAPFLSRGRKHLEASDQRREDANGLGVGETKANAAPSARRECEDWDNKNQQNVRTGYETERSHPSRGHL